MMAAEGQELSGVFGRNNGKSNSVLDLRKW